MEIVLISEVFWKLCIACAELHSNCYVYGCRYSPHTSSFLNLHSSVVFFGFVFVFGNYFPQRKKVTSAAALAWTHKSEDRVPDLLL